MKNILLPIDFSLVLTNQLRAAAQVCEEGGTITILHVADPSLSGILLSNRLSIENIDSNLLAELVWCRKILMSAEPKELKVELHVENGPVAKVISKVAAELKCDGVVIGSHGHGALHHLLHGSNTDRVMRSLNIPFCVVPSPHQECGGMMRSAGNPVLVAVETKPEAIELIRIAVQYAQRMPGPEVYIVHAIPPASPLDPAATLAKLQDLIVEACKIEGFYFKNLHPLIQVGTVPDVVQEKIRRLRPGLLVMGRHHHGLLHRLVLGSNAEAIAKAARCPSLIVPIESPVAPSLPATILP